MFYIVGPRSDSGYYGNPIVAVVVVEANTPEEAIAIAVEAGRVDPKDNADAEKIDVLLRGGK